MRLVVDTNIVVSALLWGGPPRRIFDAARAQRLTLCTSDALIAELAKVLGRPKLAHRFDLVGKTAAQTLDGYRALATLVAVDQVPSISRDPDDDHVIACAIAAGADIIVSGDRDLLVLGRHGDIRIVSAASAVAEIEAKS